MTSTSTQGLQLRSGAAWWRDTIELLSSMRFAIALLTVICIASVIGTVITQHQPYNNYINQFGPFWAQVFDTVSLYSVYSAWWFLLILAFLVLSTSLCIARHLPKISRDLKNYKENIHLQALKAFGHKAQGELAQNPEVAAQQLGQALVRGGWKVRLQERPGQGWMVAAKAGAWNKLGYLAAHGAIVLVCIGGLLDGDLMVRAQMWFNGKTVYNGTGLVSEVAPEHRLSVNNPSYRGNLFVPEGQSVDVALLNQKDGVLLQDLPFVVELKKFVVEYYPTGMPKVFASEVVLYDKETGEATPQRIEVNHPATFKGIQIYQSSFDDGGSRLKLHAIPMSAGVQPFTLDGMVGGTQAVQVGGVAKTLELTGLRTINVENMSDATASGADVRKVDLQQVLKNSTGSAVNHKDKELQNVGPSFSYKVRDAAGQAIEFNTYMYPLPTGKAVPEFLFGVRTNVNESFRYLRIPADADGKLDDFLHLRAALNDPAMRAEAARRYVQNTATSLDATTRQQLQASAQRVLDLFAGNPANLEGARLDSNSEAAQSFGLQAVAAFIEKNVPEAQRQNFADVMLRMLNGTVTELLQMARSKAGVPALDMTQERSRDFMSQAVVALSDAPLYPETFMLQMDEFEQVQASVLQVTRAPGKWIVYLGCLFLCIGVFAMLYIRERRLWVWLAPHGEGTQATMAFSSNRRNMDTDKEFAALKHKLLEQ